MQPTIGLFWHFPDRAGNWARSLALLLLLNSPAAGSDLAEQKAGPTGSDLVSRAKILFGAGKWNDILELAAVSPDHPSELDYYRGMALARLQRWKEAKDALEAGQRRDPEDKRFPLELAGVAYKLGQTSQAKTHLRRVLSLDPGDPYANEFMATLFFLEDNLEASLKYWNRIGKPFVEQVQAQPQPQVQPVLLDRAFALAPASVLQMDDLFTTRSRLDLLEIFFRYRFELLPRPDDKFDLVFNSSEKRGWGSTPVEGFVSMFRGVFYQTIHPEFFNLKQSAWNFVSLVRFDAQKRRLFSSLSGPLFENPKRRYRIFFDGRRENWDVSRTTPSATLAAGDIGLETMTAGAEIHSSVNGRWGWKSGLILAHRRFRHAVLDSPAAGPLFTEGFSVKSQLRVDRRVLVIPEKRLSLTSFAGWELAKFLARPNKLYARTQGGVELLWFPRPSGDDYRMTGRLRAGKTLGQSPFDDLFVLGQERDTDLYLRGHRGTRAHKKGSAPMGRDFLLWNWEFDKVVYEHPLFDLRLGPFLDAGRTYDKSLYFGSEEWLWDVGVQAKLRVYGRLTILAAYGRDLRTGRHALHARVTR